MNVLPIPQRLFRCKNEHAQAHHNRVALNHQTKKYVCAYVGSKGEKATETKAKQMSKKRVR